MVSSDKWLETGAVGPIIATARQAAEIPNMADSMLPMPDPSASHSAFAPMELASNACETT